MRFLDKVPTDKDKNKTPASGNVITILAVSSSLSSVHSDLHFKKVALWTIEGIRDIILTSHIKLNSKRELPVRNLQKNALESSFSESVYKKLGLSI